MRKHGRGATMQEGQSVGNASRPLKKEFTAVIEKDAHTGLYVGYVPGFPGAHSQAETLDELHRNLREVIDMLLEDGEPNLDAEFIGTQLFSWDTEQAPV